MNSIVFWIFNANLFTDFVLNASNCETVIVSYKIALILSSPNAFANLISFVDQTTTVHVIEFVFRLW